MHALHPGTISRALWRREPPQCFLGEKHKEAQNVTGKKVSIKVQRCTDLPHIVRSIWSRVPLASLEKKFRPKYFR